MIIFIVIFRNNRIPFSQLSYFFTACNVTPASMTFDFKEFKLLMEVKLTFKLHV